MRNGLIGLVSAMVLASTMATAACSDPNSSGGTGGTASTTGGSSSSGGNAPSTGGQQSAGGSATGGSAPATGGSSSTGGVPSCSNLNNPCGGDVVGTWTVQSSCLTVTGQLDMGSLGIGCTSAPITGGSLSVTGTWTANSDGTYSDNTNTRGDEQVALPPACLTVSGTTTTCDALARSAFASLGYASATCTDAAGGCNCSAHVDQTGGIGVLNIMASTGAEYTTSGNTLSLSDGRNQIPYSYCVQGNTLTLTPTWSRTGTATGTIVLQKQ